jgi:2-methylcitrate dehydratase PrpD
VACALLRKEVKPAYFSEEYIRDPEIFKLTEKTKLIPDVSPDKTFTTEIQVKMKDGKVFSARTEIPRGQIYKTPLTTEEIKAKYRSNVAYSKTVSTKNAEKALSIIERLEELKDIRELTNLLVK